MKSTPAVELEFKLNVKASGTQSYHCSSKS